MPADTPRIPCYAVKMLSLTEKDEHGAARTEIASVRAPSLSQAIALAMRRYPGCMAVHGERH